ncbi:MAG: RluA family pseudouridine synthase [Desulfomonilia bacterium]
MEEKVDITVSTQDAGSRLDIVLSQHIHITRSQAARIIEQGDVRVDGSQRKPSYKLKSGMHITGRVQREPEISILQAWDIPLDILYEDEWILVVNKPAGLVVHPGAGNMSKTLVNGLIARYPEIRSVGNPERPGIVHRLDKLTSGVMVVARNSGAHDALSHAFKAHEHTREYRALCYGTLPQDKGVIETFMGRHPKDRKKMSSKVETGRTARTRWNVLQEWKEMSLLQLNLETGRTHQIRVHLSDLGHPVVGDPQYGGKRRAHTIADVVVRAQVKALNRQMLHSHLLGIIHPGTGQWMEFTADLPDDMQQLIKLLDERNDRL